MTITTTSRPTRRAADAGAPGNLAAHLAALAERLVAGGRILLWAGAEAPELPAGLEVRGSVRLAGSADRRILEVRPARERGAGR